MCQLNIGQIEVHFCDQFRQVFLSYVITFVCNETEYNDELLAFMKNE